MSMSFFMSVDGVTGDASVEPYKDWIQVLSWSHSFNQPTRPTPSSPGSSLVEQANHADFTLTKYLDRASTALIKLCWNGKSIRSVRFVALRGDGELMQKYLTVTMDNVIVSNVSVDGGSGDSPTETVTLSYRAVKYEYTTAKGETLQSVRHDLALRMVE